MSKSADKKVSILITNYNTKNVLKDCLDNLLSLDLNLEIIVNDNDPTDGSAELVEKNYKKVYLIKSENKGLSYGYNNCLKKASGSYYLYLGTDAFPTKNTIIGLIDYFEKHPEVGLATTKLVTRDGKPDMDAHRGILTPWSAFTHFVMLDKVFPRSPIFSRYFMGYEDLDKPHEIGACISHFMFVSKSAQKKVGKWDEDYFLYGEDIDMCYRMIKKGYKVMYLPQWTTLHIKGVAMGRKSAKGIKTAAQDTPIVKTILKSGRTDAMKIYFKKHLYNNYPKIFSKFILFSIILLEKFRTVIINLKQ